MSNNSNTVTISYSIRELADSFELTPRTLRHYEDIGILKPRRQGKHRIYSTQDRSRLELTLQARDLGFSLAEFAEVFTLYDNAGEEDNQLFRFIQILRSKHRQLERKRVHLNNLLNKIDEFEKDCIKQIKDKGLIG